MEKYESKQKQILRPAMQIYELMSDFNNFTPIVSGKVEGWEATEDCCSFLVKGIRVSLAIVDKVPGQYIKLGGGDDMPLDFNMWIQLKQVDDYDTRLRLVLHAKLNMMMKMMLGSKLKEGIDQMADQMAAAFNNRPL